MIYEDLKRLLRKIDGKRYKAYKEIKGTYKYPKFILIVERVQGDPFAVPSKIRVLFNLKDAGFPVEFYSSKIREIAFRDFITRELKHAIKKICKGSRGIGKSGQIEIDCGGQEVVERNSVVIDSEMIEVRFLAGLLSRGRTILGREARVMFFIDNRPLKGGIPFKSPPELEVFIEQA